ncbi:MAG: hypothetical protein ACXW3D_00250 [Caulobacteraceae bacterium]
MAEAAVLFVSKRLQRAFAGLLCLMLAQMAMTGLQSQRGEPAPGAVRVAISR